MHHYVTSDTRLRTMTRWGHETEKVTANASTYIRTRGTPFYPQHVDRVIHRRGQVTYKKAWIGPHPSHRPLHSCE